LAFSTPKSLFVSRTKGFDLIQALCRSARFGSATAIQASKNNCLWAAKPANLAPIESASCGHSGRKVFGQPEAARIVFGFQYLSFKILVFRVVSGSATMDRNAPDAEQHTERPLRAPDKGLGEKLPEETSAIAWLVRRRLLATSKENATATPRHSFSPGKEPTQRNGHSNR